MTVQITQLTPGGQLDDFIRVPHVLYADDPAFIPQLDMMVKDQLTPAKNPFFRHAEVALFLARRDGALVGRISAQIDREHLAKHADDTGFFGFFDTIEDEAVARALVDAAADWLRKRGVSRMRGPLSLSINEEVGMLVEGFEHPPVMYNPHHKPHQDRMARAAGLDKVKDMYGWHWRTQHLGKRAADAHARIAKDPGIKIRPANLGKELDQLIAIQDDAWKDNWGHVSFTPAEAEQMRKDLSLLLDPRIALVAEIEGDLAAICLAAPNLNEAIRDLGGKLLPFGIAKLIYRLKVKSPKSGRVIMLGIKSRYRAQKRFGALALALVHELAQRGAAAGYEWAELGWTLEDNAPVNLLCQVVGAKKYKVYRLFEKAL